MQIHFRVCILSKRYILLENENYTKQLFYNLIKEKELIKPQTKEYHLPMQNVEKI